MNTNTIRIKTALVDYSKLHINNLPIFQGNRYGLLKDQSENKESWYYIYDINGDLICRLPVEEAREVFITGKLTANLFGDVPDYYD